MAGAITIRAAQTPDAEPAILLVRRSIVRLCMADHGGARHVLEGWLSNKTIENMTAWIERPGNHVLIAARDGAMAGVGAVTDGGEILLAYVDPDHRFQGVTSALVTRMEEIARQARAERIHLTTTETARAFYLARGYVPEQEPGDLFFEDENVLVKEFPPAP